MLLLSDKGRGVGEVAEIVNKSIWTVSDIIHAYGKRKLAGIQVKPQPGNHRKLTREQRREIASLLKWTPRHAGIDVPFWNIHALHTLVKQKFSVVYAAPDSYRALLYESGLSFHRPEKKYREQDPVTVRKWLIDTKKN